MVSITNKKIKGKEYLYAEYSFRLPNGKVKKISKKIKDKNGVNNKEVKNYFLENEIKEYQKYAIQIFSKDSVLTEDKIKKIEKIRVEYKQIFRRLTKKQLADILDRFTINFTYESNAIEGNSLTLKDVTLILNENLVPKDKDLREVYETRNTRVANELLFDNKIKIKLKDIVKLHAILIKDTGVSEGFKKLPNYLLMRNVKTTPPEKVEEEILNLIEEYSRLKKDMHPVKLAALFHGKFERIHPFEDGNGRVGRILINVILLENGYPPLIIRKTMRTSYFNALEASDNGYKPKLERFILEKLEKTYKDFFQIYVEYI